MTNRLHLRSAATAVVVVLLGLPAAGCTTDSPAAVIPPAPTESHSEGPAPGTADAATTAQMGLAAMFSWQPSTDASPGEALSRAGPWLTGELATTAANTEVVSVLRSLPEWAGWRDSGDIVTALVEAQAPRTVGAETLVAAVVTQLVLHRDGSSTRYQRLHVTATVANTASGWRMASYRVNPGT
ncbi:hypothetical protein [Nocardia rhizosphaerihabitans]|uniref:hypothetical protein n=1 Tax=Nocardia rhizosphaerihabitans TaxID=1691570 RepID=UPI00166BD171|nr:hypothetical protein [Nocardia rhizosphaerihabitans]